MQHRVKMHIAYLKSGAAKQSARKLQQEHSHTAWVSTSGPLQHHGTVNQSDDTPPAKKARLEKKVGCKYRRPKSEVPIVKTIEWTLAQLCVERRMREKLQSVTQ